MILVSACLTGVPCRYDGTTATDEQLIAYFASLSMPILPICPEVLGGLPVPREPSEIVQGTVKTASGTEVHSSFHAGCTKAVDIARMYGVTCGVLNERSPACGVHHIYDGTFSKTLIKGQGLLAQYLRRAGIPVYTAKEFRIIWE